MNEEIKLSKSEIIGICEFLKIHHFENSYLLLDYITNLQQENERLETALNGYKLRNGKAIEYIYENAYDSERKMVIDELYNEIPELMSILGGGDE